jgi:uncharacterized protein (DUF302 family)
MATRQIEVQRFSITSSKPFDRVMKAIDAAIGHPDISAFIENVTSAKSYADLETVLQRVIGSSGLMEFIRFDLGQILRKDRSDKAPQSLRLVVGNPLIMKQMVEHVPDAGSYAPVTILIHERTDGVHLSYDRMASFIAPYGNREASKIAEELDRKVEALLTAAAN